MPRNGSVGREQKLPFTKHREINLIITDIFLNEYHSYLLNTIITILEFNKNKEKFGIKHHKTFALNVVG